MRIEICGGISAGKTTLAKSLDMLGYSCVYEDFSSIASLDDFYAEPEAYYFETELFFLLQHMYQFKKKCKAKNCIICDYSFEQDYAYAKNNMIGNAWKVFESVFYEMIAQIQEPDLIINLQCDSEILKERITARGRVYENTISVDYLNNTIDQVNHRLNKVSTHVVYFDSNLYDFRDIEVVKKVVLPVINTYL